MKLKYPVLPLLWMWMAVMKTAAQTMFVTEPDYRNSHSALLNVHRPGGSRLHSYHRRGPYGSGVLYVHRQGPPVPSPLIIHRTSSLYNQPNKLGLLKPRASVDDSMLNQSPSSGRAAAVSSVLLAPSTYLSTQEMNAQEKSDKMPVETILYPLGKSIQKYYMPKQQAFYVRLPSDHPIRHIPVAMVVTKPADPQYFRASSWYPLEERAPSLPSARPSEPPPRPASPPPPAPLPPLFFPAHNFYTYVPGENQTNDHQPPIPALHPPHHFPYNNCYAPAPETHERSSEPLPSLHFPSSNYQHYDPSKLQAHQSNARSEGNMDSSPRSPDPAPHYFPVSGYLPYDPAKLQTQQSNARSEGNMDSSPRSPDPAPHYFPVSGYLPYDPAKLQAQDKSEARTLPHHHLSYHEAVSHTPHLAHGGGIHKHITVHRTEPIPYIHSDYAPSVYDDVLLSHGGHGTFIHEEPSLHEHVSLHLGRNAASYGIPNVPVTFDDGFHEPKLLSDDYDVAYNPWSETAFVPYEYYGYPGHPDYSRIPHIAQPSYNRNIRNDVQQSKQQDVPDLLRSSRSFQESEDKSTSTSASDKSFAISLPVDMSNTATATPSQKKDAISGDNSDFDPEKTILFDLSQILDGNEARKRSVLEAILSTSASSEKEDTPKTVPPVNSESKSSQEISERSASHQAGLGDKVEVNQESTLGLLTQIRDASLQSVHDEQEPIAPLDTLWGLAKRNKRQVPEKQSSNTSPDARSEDEDKTIGYVIGFLDPESYNYYFAPENSKSFADDQDYDPLSDYRQPVVNEKSIHGQVPIPVFYRRKKTDSYIPMNFMSYKETGSSDPRNAQEQDANSNITTKTSYWTYNKTARHNLGTDSIYGYYDPYPIHHESYPRPEPIPVPYLQFSEHSMPHHFLNMYPTKMHHPMHPYSGRIDNNPSSYFADMPDYIQEPLMDARSISNMNQASVHPIRHHPNRYNPHIPGHPHGNIRPLEANIHPIRHHHHRPGRYYAPRSQELMVDTRPYPNVDGTKVHPMLPHRPTGPLEHLPGYLPESQPNARSFHNIDDIEESPLRRHYTSKYYERISGYRPPNYVDEGYYQPNRYFDSVPARPYHTDTPIGHHYLDRYYDYPYQPDRDITSYQVDSIHGHPSRYHQLHRYHGHYQPADLTSYQKHPSRYHHLRKYYEHIHGNAYQAREAASNSDIPAINEQPQMRSDEEENDDEYPEKPLSDIGTIAEHPTRPNYPNKFYTQLTNGDPKSQIALLSFFTTDKQRPHPIRFHRPRPRPMFYPSQYMNPNREHGYNTAGYFSKLRA